MFIFLCLEKYLYFCKASTIVKWYNIIEKAEQYKYLCVVYITSRNSPRYALLIKPNHFAQYFLYKYIPLIIM